MSTKPAVVQALRGDVGVRELPRSGPVAEVLRERLGVHHLLGELVRALQVRAAAALRVQRPAGSQRREDAREERGMILDPVERRRAEHQVGPAGKRQVRQRHLHERDARAEHRPQVGARRHQHVPRAIDRDQPPARQPLHQLAGQPAAAAAGVDGALVAVHRQAVQDLLSPAAFAGRKPCGTTPHSIQSSCV